MIVSFGSRGTEDIFAYRNTASARRTCPTNVWPVARRKLELLQESETISDLADFPGNRLELLRGALQGWYSIRINSQWRIIFRWTQSGPEGVEIVDYHF